MQGETGNWAGRAWPERRALTIWVRLKPFHRALRKAALSRGARVTLQPMYCRVVVSASWKLTLPVAAMGSVPVRSAVMSWTLWEVKR